MHFYFTSIKISDFTDNDWFDFQGHSQMELEEVGAIKMPKMITAKMVPIVNIKLEINMGVISPFTQEYIGLGVNAAAHMATPLEMTLTRKLTQIALDIKVPEEIKRYLSIIEFVTTDKNFSH